MNQRLTVNLGLRFDRYRVFLPEQTHPAGRFNALPQVFAAVANVIDWSVLVPRVGMIHDLSRDGRSLLKLSYGTYSFAPGGGFNANANNSPWWTRYQWTAASDANGDGLWQPGEEDPSPLDSRGGIAPDAIDPGLKLPRLRELGAWFERELPGNMAANWSSIGGTAFGHTGGHTRDDANVCLSSTRCAELIAVKYFA